jgi:hypothetical protein
MRRREFIALLGRGLVAWPLADAGARNASDHLRRIGVLSGAPLDVGTRELASFEQRLRDPDKTLQSNIVLLKVTLIAWRVWLPSLRASK